MIHQVCVGETKLCHVSNSIERILKAGKVDGQMHKLLQATAKKVQEAFAVCVCVQSMCVCVSE